MNNSIDDYVSEVGTYEAIWTLEIQTLPDDVDKILDSIMQVHPLAYGRYQRVASVSAIGKETAQPQGGSTSETYLEDFDRSVNETYPMVDLKVSIPRELDTLRLVTEAVLEVHHYEEPVIFLREDWASRANYDPHSDNPHRWWNNGRGLPQRIQ